MVEVGSGRQENLLPLKRRDPLSGDEAGWSGKGKATGSIFWPCDGLESDGAGQEAISM